MTRDEAVERLWCPRPPRDWAMGMTNAEHFVDQLVALGMLKLDAPKSANQKAVDAMSAKSQHGLIGVDRVIIALANAGLKIVDT